MMSPGRRFHKDETLVFVFDESWRTTKPRRKLGKRRPANGREEREGRYCNFNFQEFTMAKRELSSTLRNLKFMQRGANKEEKTKKEEELIPDGNFPSFITTKKCVVIMEGDPSPVVTRGRMSFQSFNPSIDKLNEEASNPRQSESDATCSGEQGGKTSNSENVSACDGPVSLKEETSNSNKADGDLKRKQVEVITEVQLPNNSTNIIEAEQSSSSHNSRKNSHKPPKRGKLDWNVLRSPKCRNKRG